MNIQSSPPPMHMRALLPHRAGLLNLLALVMLLVLAVPLARLISPVPLRSIPWTAGFGRLALAFVPNRGQTDPAVRMEARGLGGSLFFTPGEVVLVTAEHETLEQAPVGHQASAVLRIQWHDANPAAQVRGVNQLAGIVSYLDGPDPAGWQTSLPTYGSVRYEALYPGIDLRYDGADGRLKGTYTVAPGADPAAIHWSYAGARSVQIDAGGNLVVTLASTIRSDRHEPEATLIESAPVAWQERAGGRVPIAARYVLQSSPDHVPVVSFAPGAYDPALPLTIDPTLSYSTYLGGTGFDQGYGIAVDAAGNTYVTGAASTGGFPTTPGAFQNSGSGSFVAKLNPAGTALIYSTLINGAHETTIKVDGAGNAYLTGYAGAGFPTTAGAYQTGLRGGFDAFVAKLNPQGSGLAYSTLLGGGFDDLARDIAIDSAGSAYITGWTACRAPTCDFPTLHAFQPAYGGGNNDAFVAKLNPSGTGLLYSTYLGGGATLNSTDDWGEGIAVDSAGSAYVTGYSFSPDFPITAGTLGSYKGSLDGFVTKFAPDGATVAYSTYLGGVDYDQPTAIAVDAIGNAYITGLTDGAYPTTAGAYRRTGTFDAFVTKLNPTASAMVYSTLVGGNGTDSTAGVDRAWGIALDSSNNAYIVGDTTSVNLPTVDAFQATYGGGLKDAFVAKLNAAGSAVPYLSYLGGNTTDEGRGIAVNSAGNAYVTGYTTAANFPVTPGVVQGRQGGGLEHPDDAFITKIAASSGGGAPTLAALTLSRTTVAGGVAVQGTVELSAPAPTGGALVALTSSNRSVAKVPAGVTVPAGSSRATFTITTRVVAVSTQVTISAALGGVTKSALLTVRPAR